MKKLIPSNKKNITCNCFNKGILLVAIAACALIPQTLLAQKAQAAADTIKAREYESPQLVVKPTYPKVVGYLSFILPIVTINNTSTTTDFSKGTSNIGFPVGVNVLYSDKFGFSYEFTPNIEATGGSSKVNKILFDPGTMFRFDHGFTIITRLAFDTQGRYGFTPVFNQVYLRTKDVNYFVALSVPARFGDSEAASIGLNLQIGFIFN
jgi:hypothetical protein